MRVPCCFQHFTWTGVFSSLLTVGSYRVLIFIAHVVDQAVQGLRLKSRARDRQRTEHNEIKHKSRQKTETKTKHGKNKNMKRGAKQRENQYNSTTIIPLHIFLVRTHMLDGDRTLPQCLAVSYDREVNPPTRHEPLFLPPATCRSPGFTTSSTTCVREHSCVYSGAKQTKQ